MPLARDPLAVFMVVGAIIFVLYSSLNGSDSTPVRYSSTIEAALVENFEMVAGRKATEEDRARLRQEFVTDELLFREALDRGMHLTDAQVKSRLTDRARILLVGIPDDPQPEELVEFYAENLDLYRIEPRTSFDQVFFNQPPSDPGEVLAALRAGETVRGDDLWTGVSYPDYGDSMVRGIFGPEFLAALKEMDEGEWLGPIPSVRGVHYVRKTGVMPETLAPFAVVEAQVARDLQRAQTTEAIEEAVAGLKEKFEVEYDS